MVLIAILPLMDFVTLLRIILITDGIVPVHFKQILMVILFSAMEHFICHIPMMHAPINSLLNNRMQ